MPDNYEIKIDSGYFEEIEPFCAMLFGTKMGKYKGFKSYDTVKVVSSEYYSCETTAIRIYTTDKGPDKFPFNKEIKDAKSLANFISDFLETVEYHRQPGHDGDNKKGYSIITNNWEYITVKPLWMMYEK